MLPAWSIAVPENFWFAPSVVTTMGAGHTATPEPGSAQPKLTVTSPVRQPAAFAAGVTIALIAGGRVSMETVALVDALLPARSAAVPVTVVGPFALTVIGGVHVAMPDVASEQANETVTGFRYQPPLEGGRFAAIVGAVLSRLTVSDVVAVLPAPSPRCRRRPGSRRPG